MDSVLRHRKAKQGEQLRISAAHSAPAAIVYTEGKDTHLDFM